MYVITVIRVKTSAAAAEAWLGARAGKQRVWVEVETYYSYVLCRDVLQYVNCHNSSSYSFHLAQNRERRMKCLAETKAFREQQHPAWPYCYYYDYDLNIRF